MSQQERVRKLEKPAAKTDGRTVHAMSWSAGESKEEAIERAKEYLRQHPGHRVFLMLFPPINVSRLEGHRD